MSPATVSNALNHPEKLAPSTLERIRVAIDELGYVRNDAARQLRAGNNIAVGMVVLDVANPFFTDIARGVEDVLHQHRRPLILGNSAQSAAREASYLDLFEEQRVSGLLITPTGSLLPRLRRLRSRGIAVVLVDRHSGGKEFSSVSVDDKTGGRLAAEHLLSLGRRRLAFIGGPATLPQVRQRLAAARAAVDHEGARELIFIETVSMDAVSGRRGAQALLNLPKRQRPDALFAANDLVALGALQAFTLAGVKVPDDIALIGFDDIDFAESAAVPLSSIRQPAVEMGRVAADLLLDVIADSGSARIRRPVLQPELVIRRSTSGA